MAARRLLIVMLILLGLSTLAAALVPPQSLREGTTTGTTEPTETTPTETLPQGADLSAKIAVAGKSVPVVSMSCPVESSSARKCEPLRVGDELSLVVASKRFAQLTIPAFGLLKTASPLDPARFDLLFQEPGTYKILFAPSKRVAARIEVEKRGSPGGARSRARAGSDRA